MKKTITVPPCEEHRIGDVYYRAGDTYEIETSETEKFIKENKENGNESTDKT
jgi:hypothetical protein